MFKTPSYRMSYFYLFAVCILLLVWAAYLQYFDGIDPCLLCMMQRILVFLLAITFLAASLHNHNITSRKIYNWLALILTALGMLIAGRQIWLQHLPPSTQDYCVPGYSYLIASSSWSTLLKYAVMGTPSCQEVSWSFLGFSAASWSMIFFILFFVAIIWQFKRQIK